MTKLMKTENFAEIEVLDMSGNSLEDDGAKVIADLLKDPKSTITKLNVSQNKLSWVGLQRICSVLADEKSKVTELNIKDNKIPDRNLKVLMGMLYLNENLTKIKYTATEPKNVQSIKEFKQSRKQFEVELKRQNKELDEQAVENFCQEISMQAENKGHELHLKCWHYIVFPVWIWKTFIHAKHKAFHHKFDSKALKEVEE